MCTPQDAEDIVLLKGDAVRLKEPLEVSPHLVRRAEKTDRSFLKDGAKRPSLANLSLKAIVLGHGE